MSIESIGEKLRRLREENGLSLRKVAAMIDIDIAILSKMERGERRLTKEIVKNLAEIYKCDTEELLVLYLSEKVVHEIGEEELALKALQVAEEQIEYMRQPVLNRDILIKKIVRFLSLDGRVKKAWIFGSFARGNNMPDSDIDLMVTYSDKATGTLLDYADIKFQLEEITGKRIDLVEAGFIKSFALENINKDKKLIYG